MKIAVLSGKGGTGKTTVSTNLAFISKLPLFDTDIEEPNSHIFLKNNILEEKSVYMNYPKVDMEKCNLCGECGDFCKFNAVIPARNTVLINEFEIPVYKMGDLKTIDEILKNYKDNKLEKYDLSPKPQGLRMA